MARMVLVASMVVLIGSSGAAVEDEDSDSGCPTTWSEGAQACVWALVSIEKPIVVRVVGGTLVNEGGGEWPEGVDVSIELAERGRIERRRVGHAQVPSGAFRLSEVQPGEYCFRIGVRPIGWSCIEGRIVVSEQAAPNARIVVTVPLGK